ncbi:MULTISPECIES: hypothetical protein [Aphanizomenon]|uniref:hypothetical protein n=1 Tax=Aphanizomenon TaxID=1175 RepID=UPI000542291F|nr:MULTISPECIES: hypothetical protein [Aphanizomenon]KHG41414.1 hypothetical protein OA07_11550 [Aphanizomenon flos-aquae 2012/KM1/D3]MTJ31996.1 hypothetical protein [Aphanizomenon sp. UHCC 0183]QSV73829.1 MAG: hypothetical protein HEQ20_27465 [Aphanizomenon flos-aquae KM1D3_PB]
MTVHLPEIGIPSFTRAISLLEEYPQNIVGSFWVMCGYGFNDKEKIPDWWIDNVLKDNQAQGIIDGFEKGYFKGEYNNPLYLGFCIIVVADYSNPAHLSYDIQHLRMWECEGIALLRIMALHNIPSHTPFCYPDDFLNYRYGKENPTYQYLRETLNHWSVQVWEDYCSYLMSVHGQRMFYDYCKKINSVKDEVQATVEKGTKPLVLTEGETDVIYIKTALELLGEKEILVQVDIEWVGISIGKGKSINAGDGGLNNTRDVLISNPKFLTRKVLLLYDCDTGKSNENHELLKIRKIPQQKNRKVKKGIENLFPDCLFTEEFYVQKTKYGEYGEENQIQEFQKMKFCKWICEERKQADDFVDFKIIIDFIKDCLGTLIY